MVNAPTANETNGVAKKKVEDGKVLMVYELELDALDGSPSKEKAYVRLPPPVEPYVLRISIDAGSRASKNAVLHTNFPLDGSDFERSKFHQKSLPTNFSKPIQIDLPITTAGVFEFSIEHDSILLGSQPHPQTNGTTNGGGTQVARVKSRPGYFNVDPVILLPSRTPILSSDHAVLPPGSGGKVNSAELVPVPLDGLVIQSVISKWMGPLSAWKPYLTSASDRGYNMLHFTPLQMRGESNSPYSIWEQNEFADDLWEEDGNKGRLGREEKEKRMRESLEDIKKTYGLGSMVDVVLNHTANNSDWLQDHPEAGYNALNSPHLEAAVLLDTSLLKFSHSIPSLGLPTTLKSTHDLDLLMNHIQNHVLPPLNLWQFYVIDVDATREEFRAVWSGSDSGSKGATGGENEFAVPTPDGGVGQGREGIQGAELVVAEGLDLKGLKEEEIAELFVSLCLPKNWDRLGKRFHAKVNVPSAVAFVAKLIGVQVGDKEETERAVKEVGKLVDVANVRRYRMYDEDMKSVVEQVRNRTKWLRLDGNGPLLGEITEKNPLTEPYFTHIPKTSRSAKHDPASLAVANNGWIWNANPLEDFASPSSRAYLRREVMIWGDCVKLRFGATPEDNPWLWQHMTKYVESLAGLFDGFRIDNCHSTPIHVGERLLDAARRVNRNLYVCAELFTGSEEMDTYFVSRLGLNSLIREAMNGHDPKEMSRLLYSYGVGKPVGSMDGDCLTTRSTIVSPFSGSKASSTAEPVSCYIVPLQGSRPHAFLMDCTHDNEAPYQKRTPEDALPTGTLVALSWSAVGSNRGFDDLYPKTLDLVGETRRYELPEEKEERGAGEVKRLVNHLHVEMAREGYVEGHYHQENDYLVVQRVHPVTRKGYVVVAHTAFHNRGKDRGATPQIRLVGAKAKYLLGGYLDLEAAKLDKDGQPITGDDKYLKGIAGKFVTFDKFDVVDKDGATEIPIPDNFPPGSVAVFATWLEDVSKELDELCLKGADEAVKNLDTIDLNVVLYRCGEEEHDTIGDGTYRIPSGDDGIQLAYAGLEGWMHPLRHIMKHNDLGHPLCDHLRQGTWAFDFVVGRLEKYAKQYPNLVPLAAWFKERFDAVSKSAPFFLRPRYFAMIINEAYKASRAQAISLCSDFVKNGTALTQNLALTSLQMYGSVPSASLWSRKDVPSLAAGLPHFATSWARTWGRDTGIAMRGQLIVTGQYDAAKEHILALGSVVQHGLVPNLVGSAK